MTTRRSFLTGLMASAATPVLPVVVNPILGDGQWFLANPPPLVPRFTHQTYALGQTFSLGSITEPEYVALANRHCKALAASMRIHRDHLDHELVERIFG
jgi:hypothetical protein